MGRPRHRLQIAQKNHRRNENGQGNRTFPKVRPFPLSGEENPKYLLHQLKRAPVLPRVKGPIRIRNLPRPSRRRRMTCSLPGTETLRTHISLYPASMILCNKNEGLANEKPAEGWKNLGTRPISPNGLTEVGAVSADWPRPDNVMRPPNSTQHHVNAYHSTRSSGETATNSACILRGIPSSAHHLCTGHQSQRNLTARSLPDSAENPMPFRIVDCRG